MAEISRPNLLPVTYEVAEQQAIDKGAENLTIEEMSAFRWVETLKAISIVKAKANAMGGRQTFYLLMAQANMPIKSGPGDRTARLDKGDVSKWLNYIVPHLADVAAWLAKLDQVQLKKWSAPTSWLRHCPALKEKADTKSAVQSKITPTKDDIIADLNREIETLRMTAKGSEVNLDDAAGNIIYAMRNKWSAAKCRKFARELLKAVDDEDAEFKAVEPAIRDGIRKKGNAAKEA
jgi:hypothetical protein